jgi:hypothetical protein
MCRVLNFTLYYNDDRKFIGGLILQPAKNPGLFVILQPAKNLNPFVILSEAKNLTLLLNLSLVLLQLI